ncbi:MAG: malectin domain-containing carbohydrate-binding protein [Acidobacteriota bacterium]
MSTVLNNQTSRPLPDAATTQEERRELEAVSAALANSHRLRRLLTYIGESYFQGETDKLHEYEIATEVFGRSKATFNPGDDAIVRVEAHRLRKRLKDFYENEGKDHPIQLSIPAGTYVPVFIRRGEFAPLLAASPPKWATSRIYLPIAAVLALGIVAFFSLRKSGSKQAHAAGIPPAIAAASLKGVAFARVPLRICAGYDGKPQVDTAGVVWQPDQYFERGGTYARPQNVVFRTSDPLLFEHWRSGDFSYQIPLRPGVYELHLYFASQDPSPSGPEPFSISVNGNILLNGFDINSDALGTDVADERVFRDVSPGPDGKLQISFDSAGSSATLNAIEVLPGQPGALLPIRIITRPTSFTDRNGQFWHPDNYYLGGYTSEKRLPVTGATDPGLYGAERYGHFSYAIPVDTRDRYTLVLHFAELYFGPNASGTGGAGSRVFNVSCNGESLLENFDIYKEAGGLHALTETFHHLKPTSQGKLNINFEPVANYATVSAIEVLDESR